MRRALLLALLTLSAALPSAEAEATRIFKGLAVCAGDAEVLSLSEPLPYTLCTPAGRCSAPGAIFKYQVRCEDGRVFQGPEVYAENPNSTFSRVTVQSNAVVLFLGAESTDVSTPYGLRKELKDVFVTLPAGYAPLPDNINMIDLNSNNSITDLPAAPTTFQLPNLKTLFLNFGASRIAKYSYVVAVLITVILIILIFASSKMSYIRAVLQPGETILELGELHWIIYAPSFICGAIGLIMLLFGLLYLERSPTILPVGSTFIGLALLSAVCSWFKWWTTELGVTSQRVIYKTGFIWRNAIEMNLNKVVAVNVYQTVLGRLLNYGTLHILGAGRGIEHLHRIATPLRLRSAIK